MAVLTVSAPPRDLHNALGVSCNQALQIACGAVTGVDGRTATSRRISLKVDAKQALVQFGFKATDARAAIDRAGPCDSLEALVREALRYVR